MLHCIDIQGAQGSKGIMHYSKVKINFACWVIFHAFVVICSVLPRNFKIGDNVPPPLKNGDISKNSGT